MKITHKEIRNVLEKNTKIGSLSQDYGKIVDDILHIENAYELKKIDDYIAQQEAFEAKVKKYFEAPEDLGDRWQKHLRLALELREMVGLK